MDSLVSIIILSRSSLKRVYREEQLKKENGGEANKIHRDPTASSSSSERKKEKKERKKKRKESSQWTQHH